MSVARYPSLAFRLTVGSVVIDGFGLLDSGFEGFMAVPIEVVASLPAPEYRQEAETVSGEFLAVPVWFGSAELADVPGAFDVRVIAIGDEFLIGLQTMNQFRITLDHGRRVLVEP
jgi:predicted aspartyl protease